MDISQKVMTDFSRGGGRCIRKGESEDAASDNVFDDTADDGGTTPITGARSPLDSQILDDWLAEAVHQLTRATASNTVRVAADNLLVTIASKHCYFKQVLVLKYFPNVLLICELELACHISHMAYDHRVK